MAELFLEILSEEMPALMQSVASDEILLNLQIQCKKNNVTYSEMKSFYGPRRLSFLIDGLPEELPDLSIEKKGPQIDADSSIIEAFIKTHNVKKTDLVSKKIKNREYYFIQKTQKAPKINEILSAIICEVVSNYRFPKSMRWLPHEKTDFAWIRPLKNILCIFNEKILPISFSGLKSDNLTFGHRFMKNDPVAIFSFQEYEAAMAKMKVIYDQDERLNLILQQIEKICNEKNLFFEHDKKLLQEVCGLVEFPNVLLGKIDEKFMSLPKEIIENSLRDHQKYFILRKSEQDRSLSNFFIIVANVLTENDEQIVQGNERVVRARLDDAEFFIKQDKKICLKERQKFLKNISFHGDLGSLYDKILRMKNLAQFINENCDLQINAKDLEMAVELCKSDLTTEIVSEFPNLQGIMGAFFAKEENLSEDVAIAIKEHYLPNSAQNTEKNMPQTIIGAVVSLADKIDSLVGIYIAEGAPSSSKDPFALRRMTIGIMRLMVSFKLHVNLQDLLNFVKEQYCEAFPNDEIFSKFAPEKLKAFFTDRFKHQYGKEFTQFNLVNAVTSIGLQDPYLAHKKLCSLNSFMQNSEAQELISQYRRTSNILKNSKLSNEKIDYNIFETQQEKDLFQLTEENDVKLNVLLEEGKFDESFKLLLSYRQSLANFFDSVMVMDEKKSVAENRQKILNKIKSQFEKIADFSKLEVN